VTIVQLAQALQLLLQLFHDLNSQDLPPFFEEHMNEFMGDPAASQETDQGRGWLRKYLIWERPELMGDDEEDTPGPLQKIRASICEIAELYAQRYLEVFPQLGLFVDGVWRMLSGVGLGTREDVLVSRALRFLSVVVKMGSHRDLFAAPETLRGFCERIVLPNMAIRRE
jgi:exportin-2 (importin alpha re-exporter)